VKGVHSLGNEGCGEEKARGLELLWEYNLGFGAIVCGEWTTSGLDLLVGSKPQLGGGLLLREN
jgi:hypothetical protein